MGRGLGKKNEPDSIESDNQLGPLASYHEMIIPGRGVLAGAGIQQGDWQSELFSAGFAQFANPNITKTDWVAMVLQRDRLLFRMSLVRRSLEPTRRPGQFNIHTDPLRQILAVK